MDRATIATLLLALLFAAVVGIIIVYRKRQRRARHTSLDVDLFRRERTGE